jgi:hypothetical protein
MMLADGRDIQSHRSLLLSLISTRRFAHPSTIVMNASKRVQLAKIDARIASLEFDIILAKRERNSLSLLRYLPMEIISQILREVVEAANLTPGSGPQLCSSAIILAR